MAAARFATMVAPRPLDHGLANEQWLLSALPADGHARAADWARLDLNHWHFQYMLRAQQTHVPDERRLYKRFYQELVMCRKRSYRVAFVHVLKAAGTSVKAQLLETCKSRLDEVRRCRHAVTGITEVQLCRTRFCGYLCRDFDQHFRCWGATRNHTAAGRNGTCTGSPFMFTLVRDPVQRLVSAFVELRQRVEPNKDYPRSYAGGWVSLLSSLQRAGHFWNQHLLPQWLSLLSDFGEKLPLDFIGTSEKTDDILGVLRAAQAHGTQCLATCRDCARVQGRQYCRSDRRQHYRGRPGEHHSLSPIEAPPSLTAEQTRLICRLYMGDYVAFSLPVPTVCADIFAQWQLPAGNSSHRLPAGFNPFNIALTGEGSTSTGIHSKSLDVSLDDFNWRASLARWISVELQEVGVSRQVRDIPVLR